MTQFQKDVNEGFSRLSKPLPKFWKKVRRIGIGLGVIGTALATAPIALPAAIVGISGYLITAGIVATAASQLTKEDE